MKKSVKLIKCIGFLAGLAVILMVLDYAFAPSGYVRYIMHLGTDSSKNYDTVILGASHTRAAVNPEYLDSRLGVKAVNMAIPGETVEDSYYILKEVSEKQNIKTVIFDIDYQYWFEFQPVDHFTKSFVYQQFTQFPVKTQYIWQEKKYMDIRNVFTSRLSWNCSLDSARKNIEVKSSDIYKNYDIEAAYDENGFVEGADGPYIGDGFFARGTDGKRPPGEDYLNTWVDRYNQNIDPAVEKQFKKIVNLCQEKGIHLICITSPITPTSVQKLRMNVVHNTMNTFLNGECGLEYYDFNNALMSAVPRDDINYGDQEGHMGGEVANIFSESLANLLYDVNNGTYDKNKYFYATFEDMYKNMKSDYTQVTGKTWEGY